MAIIKPFKGIRPPQNLVEQVASRPYDVLNSEEARAEAEGNEKMCIRDRLYPDGTSGSICHAEWSLGVLP